MGAFKPGAIDIYLIRTLSKQIVDGVIHYTVETNMGKVVYAGADDCVDANYIFVLGMALENKKIIIPFHVQLFKRDK